MAFILAIGIPFLIGLVIYVRVWQQKEADKYRRHYVAAVPSSISFDQMMNFTRSLASLPRPKFFTAVHSVVVETYADASGIKYYLSIPGHVLTDVEGLFRTHLGGRLVPGELPHNAWSFAYEVGLKGTNVPLQISSPEAAIASILSSFQTLKVDDALVMQWVITPSHPQLTGKKETTKWPVAEIDPARHKEKFGDVNFLAVGRLAGRGPNAEGLVRGLFGRLAGFDTYGSKLSIQVSWSSLWPA